MDVANPLWYDGNNNFSARTTQSTLQHSIGIGMAFRDWIPSSVIETNRCIHSCQSKRNSSADQGTRRRVIHSLHLCECFTVSELCSIDSINTFNAFNSSSRHAHI